MTTEQMDQKDAERQLDEYRASHADEPYQPEPVVGPFTEPEPWLDKLPEPHERAAAIHELCEAIRLTVEYVGMSTLPPIAGWSWFDALTRYQPAVAKAFAEQYQADEQRQAEAIESDDRPTQAEEPVEDRLQRAFCNGFVEGVRRGSWGRYDHS
jgi:hypothetical protein